MRNDTEHLLSSPKNAARLLRSIREIYNGVLVERIPDDMRALLEKLK